jgi:hypothetical protein
MVDRASETITMRRATSAILCRAILAIKDDFVDERWMKGVGRGWSLNESDFVSSATRPEPAVLASVPGFSVSRTSLAPQLQDRCKRAVCNGLSRQQNFFTKHRWKSLVRTDLTAIEGEQEQDHPIMAARSQTLRDRQIGEYNCYSDMSAD